MCNPCKPLLKTGLSVFLHVRVHVIRKKTCKQWWFPSPMCSLNVTVTAVCEGGEKKRKKVICYNRQALLLLACCGLTGFRNFLWQIWSPVRISTALLDTRTRTGMESLESVQFTGSSQREERPFFPPLPGQTLGYIFTTAFILEKWATKLEFIISMIAVDHWGATLKFEKWDWFNLMITWMIVFSFDSWQMWAVNEPVFNWPQISPLSFMHKSSRLPHSLKAELPSLPPNVLFIL